MNFTLHFKVLYMNQNEKYFNDLVEVRKLMEKSSKFISLSGWSGILAGVYALIGLYLAKDYIHSFSLGQRHIALDEGLWEALSNHSYLFLLAAGVVTLSLITGIFLTAGKAKQKGQTMLDKIALKMVVNLGIPVVAGGAFILMMINAGYYQLLVPAMLIFYGLGLINGSKYTMPTIRNLGSSELGLGILAGILPEYDLIFWAIGFGLMHIIYGAYMWWTFERKA
jgi:hypothetical protein